MQTSELLEKLHALKPNLSAFNIKRMAVFGSHARGDANEDSDVDLIVEFIDPVGYFDFVKTKRQLQDFIQCPVDLITFNALKTDRHKEILEEAIDV
jgi:hypothetical protein